MASLNVKDKLIGPLFVFVEESLAFSCESLRWPTTPLFVESGRGTPDVQVESVLKLGARRQNVQRTIGLQKIARIRGQPPEFYAVTKVINKEHDCGWEDVDRAEIQRGAL